MNEILVTTLTKEELERLVIDCLKVYHRYNPPPITQAPAPPPARVLTINEAAALTGLARGTIYKMTSAGTIPHSKRGKKLYFEREALEAWLTSNRVHQAAADDRAAEVLAASIERQRRRR